MHKQEVWGGFQMKRKIYFLMAITIIFSVILLTNINAKSSDKVEKVVFDKLNDQNKVKVFVQFDANANYKKVSKAIEENKNNAIEKIGKTKVKHDFGGFFSAELTANELNLLADDPTVTSIKLVETKHILLQNSVGIINSSITWPKQISGINLTGAGQTVCIIDTGVNYTNPDLGGCYGNNSPTSGCKILGGWDYCADNVGCTTQDNDPMDIQGHGTHVSGIVVANGTITGVAPRARVIMIKAANSSGTFSDDDIIAGINWCVGNATAFNISVISMSLGGDLFTDYCNSDSLAPSINNAVGNNISVVVAAGNDISSTQISSPACVQNATAVGSTTKSDAISSFSNRNNLTLLLAPGGDGTVNGGINSTCIDGTYCSKSGTSMATPHVAGAFAIINQFLKLTGQNPKTPKQIESVLNLTGKKITDSATGLNYSRININSALNSLSFNYVSLILPSNNQFTNQNQTFSCNASSNVNLTNATFYLYNSTGLENNSLSNSISNLINSTTFSYNFTHEGNYTWNCLFVNNLSYQSFASANFSLTYEITIPAINFTNPTETSGLVYRRTSIIINVTANDTNLANITIRLFNTTGLVNQTTTTASPNFVNITNLPDGTYYFNATATDSAGNMNSTETRNVTIDTVVTSLQFVSPTLASGTFRNQNYIEINVTASDNNLANTTLRLFNSTNDLINSSVTGISSLYLNVSGLAEGIYFYNATAIDTLNNVNNTETRNITLDRTAPLVTMASPTATTYTSNSYNIDIRLNEAGICNYSIDSGTTNNTLTANSTNSGFTATRSGVSNGNYVLNAYCVDLAGNQNYTANVGFTVTVTASSSSGGGGGGGGGATTETTATTKIAAATQIESESGYTTELKKDDKVQFEIKNIESGNTESHTVTVSSIGTNFANLIIASDPINLTLLVGESEKLNLTSSNYYDLYVKLESIIGSKANITIKNIKEEIKAAGTAPQQNNTNTPSIAVSEELKISQKSIQNYIYYTIGILVLGIVIVLFTRKFMPPHHRAKIRHIVHHTDHHLEHHKM